MKSWLEMLVADYAESQFNGRVCLVCETGDLCNVDVVEIINDVAECWEGLKEDVAAWAYITHVGLAGRSIPTLQDMFLAYRQQVAQAERALLDDSKPVVKREVPEWCMN